MSSKAHITLMSSDRQLFMVTEAVAVQSVLIRTWIKDKPDAVNSRTIHFPVEQVTSKILEKVIEYCKNHVEGGLDANFKDLEAFDAHFVNVDYATLYRVIKAAMYLHIQSLIDLIAQTLAQKIKGMSQNRFRSTFNIKTSFSINEEDMFLNKHGWAR